MKSKENVKDLLIIPSATYASEDIQESFGKIPFCLIPVSGVPIINHIIKKYSLQNFRILIVAKEGINQIESVVEKNKDVEIIEIDQLRDLGYTIQFALEYALKFFGDISRIVINFADTLIEDLSQVLVNKDCIFYSEVYDSLRWTTFNNDNGKIKYLADKENLEGSQFNGFIGVFTFVKPKELLASFKIIRPSKKMDSFYGALLEYNKKFDFIFVKIDNWRDLGHKDEYLSTKKKLQFRFFNSIQIDETRGILTKKSNNEEKLKKEIQWYLKLPSNLLYVIPSIYNYSMEYKDVSVSMEYYGYPTLSELMVYGNLEMRSWQKFMNKLFFIVDEFRKYQIVDLFDQKIHSIDQMYLKKTTSRLYSIRDNKNFTRFFKNVIKINGKTYPTLSKIIEDLDEYIKIMKLRDDIVFSIIHGDLCFSNILYDVNSGIIRLIDPRGSFGAFDIYGDVKYDMAKVSHSINSGYDFIISDMFEVNDGYNEINYKIRKNNNCKILSSLFDERIQGQELKKIRFIESLLYLSMPPLHADFPKRQKVMLANGIELLFKTLNENG